MRRWRSPESLLAPIAEALARFVCTEDFSNVKACEGHALSRSFSSTIPAVVRVDGEAWRCSRQSREAGYASEPARSSPLISTIGG